MKMQTMGHFVTMLVAAAIGTSGAWAAKKKDKTTVPPVALGETGRQLEARYAAQMEALKAEILKSLPNLDPQKREAYLKSCEAEVAAKAAVEAAQKDQGAVARGQALVAHAKGKWIGGADKGIAAAKDKLSKAKSDAERKAAQDELAKWEKNREEGVQALKERQAQLDAALKDQAAAERKTKEAETALAKAKSNTLAVMSDLGLKTLLSSDTLDAKLAGYSILVEATPRGLAAFAEKSEAGKELIERMFSDGKLLVQMAVADGANGGNCGRAMEIYSQIQKASPMALEGNLQRLALAVALEHAVPIAQRNADSASNAPTTVDPVGRYLHYEKAFLDGELDPGFKNLTVWDYRMVVDGEEPNEITTWGRQMLRNYRPDQIATSDYRWRYVESVRSDIKYGSGDNQYDEAELHFFQNILKNGGICGRRAFFGRFILRAFGIPTTARPQSGHAALVHWTPDGWVPCLGAGWGSGWTKTRYEKDLDFLATTQARAIGDAFMQVKRAQWIGDVMGEPRVFGFLSGKPGFWYGVSLHTQRAIIESAKSKALDAVGQDIAEANETKEKVTIAKVSISEADRKVTVDSKGVITIPASATTKPTQSTGKLIFMDSVLGGKQLHYSRNGGHQEFEYTIDAPSAGKYALSARVVTPSWKQNLRLQVNEAKETITIDLPFTVGMWDHSKPVEIELNRGKNVLRFSRDGDIKGVTIKDFTLIPASR